MPEGLSHKSSAEFDGYAEGYEAGMENPLKRFVGRSADEFIEFKAHRLKSDLRRRPLQSSRPPDALEWLDFGCGTGVFLRMLKKCGFSGVFHGCDVSVGMLAEASSAWTAGDAPEFGLIGADGRLPYKDHSFDVVLASAVLHHVPRADRPGVYREIARVLRPGGRFYVFEHNPLNPITRWVVSHTAIDQNAILLKPREVRAALSNAGLVRLWTSSMMFFPPRWHWAWPIDERMAWLPLGGQYAVSGEQP